MIDDKKEIVVTNISGGLAGFALPNSRANFILERPGAWKKIMWKDLREAYYSTGVETMFKEGVLSIDDQEAINELGDLNTVLNSGVIMLSKVEVEDFLINNLPKMKDEEIKSYVKKMSRETYDILQPMAVEMKIRSVALADVFNEISGYDLFKSINLLDETQLAQAKEKAEKEAGNK